MDLTNIVFKAASDGLHLSLRNIFERLDKAEVAKLVAAKTNGSTPLVAACRNGHYDVAEYLIESCNANVEQTGSVNFDGETIEEAPPLWCAAAVGHLRLVKLLVRNDACINSTTKTNSTPLRTACFDGHFEIVKFLVRKGADIEIANRHGHTCLMIACFNKHYNIASYLVRLGADVNRKSVKGNTALHDCAESGSLEILKMLLANGAKMDVDSYGLTPLLSASLTGQKHIVEYLIQFPELVSRSERIDALELLGATFVDRERNMKGAVRLWKLAMQDRLNSANGKLPKPQQLTTLEAYDHTREVNDLESLEGLLVDPDKMRMQALLIRERILGPAHPDTCYYIRFRGAAYADAGNFDRCIELWTYALDLQQKVLEPLNPMTQSSLLSFAELFSFFISEESRSDCRPRGIPPVPFPYLALIYSKAVNEVKYGVQLLEKIPKQNRDETSLQRLLVIALHLGSLLTRVVNLVPADRREQLRQTMYKTTYQLVRLGVKGKCGRSLLHLACWRDSGVVASKYWACQFPSPGLASMLLDVGANACARDDDGNTALHLVAMSNPTDTALLTELLDHGAHIDAVNDENETMETLLKSRLNQSFPKPLRYKTLACLAAKVLRKHTRKEYYLDRIPVTLVPFVLKH